MANNSNLSISDGVSLAREYHRNLPERIRDYLRSERGILEEVIDLHLLGWSGQRITIPVFDREGRFAFFKLAKSPDDRSESPKMLATPGAHAELYGWERVQAHPERIFICEGEFDRLILESHGFGAVTSTGGALTFRAEWAEAFGEIPNVFICFDNDEAGRDGAKRVAQLIPHAKVVRLPDEVGAGGDITDFFVRLGKSREEFLTLLEAAQPLPQEDPVPPSTSEPYRTVSRMHEEVEDLKSLIAIEELIGRYFPLRPSGQNLVGRCPFHEDRNPSFLVFPQTRSFYCFGCREHGDALAFLMRMEHLTFPEALKALREFTT